eukprot:TRINITY_DN11651_c0_g8_i1.p2 TRINITY_DN11651_c0_g8~~TRINITY_DN11651_c0_g8_i1.p2  ORF type:complete len:114 (+),score=9.47 TRINITY_DN11651_c0_g8_i1:43-342(+)
MGSPQSKTENGAGTSAKNTSTSSFSAPATQGQWNVSTTFASPTADSHPPTKPASSLPTNATTTAAMAKAPFAGSTRDCTGPATAAKSCRGTGHGTSGAI